MSHLNSLTSKLYLICGLELNSVRDLYVDVQNVTSCGYKFLLVPIVHPRFHGEFISGKPKNRSGAFTRSDLILNSNDWTCLIVGKISNWIDVDSSVEAVRKNSEHALLQEINYALHLSLPAIMVSITGVNCVNLARIIYNTISLNAHTTMTVWVHVPMRSAEDESKMFLNIPKAEHDSDSFEIEYTCDTWTWWNTFRGICNSDKKIGLVLEFSADLPSDEEIDRWLGEPLRCIIIPTSLFLTNKKGFPVLPKSHQSLLKRIYKLNAQIVITGMNRHESIKHYQQYVDHLWQTKEPDDVLSSYSKGYEDYLQIPLQPLMDNLQSDTYETFEKDPVKYQEYQKAMYEAIVDKIPEDEIKTKEVVLMVVGAGRGPLVRCALHAACKAGRTIKVYAVEKNPNAIVTLQTLQDEIWGDRVTVVSCDMRDWNAPEKADILVSELLGSFGDNELSPECLDGAQKFLKDDGISIPSSYTSFLSPISSPKIYSEVSGMREKDKHPLAFFEMPFVVRLHNRTEIVPSQPLFTFDHPNRDEVIDNTRYKKLTFKLPYNCTIHGFAGYFEATLYNEIKLSIVPETHSEDMFSWFPVFMPHKDPIYVETDREVEIHFWRCVSKKNVWYEWLVMKPILGTIHNPNGRSYTIGL